MFFDRTHSKEKLARIVNDLRRCSSTPYVSNTLRGCRFDYCDVHRKTTALTQHGGEHADLLTNDMMFKAIHSQVKKAMKYLAQEISKTDKRFASKVVLVGSAKERTKLGRCDEFDFNFVLTDLSRSCALWYSPESPPGFVLLKASTPAYDKELFDDSRILNTRTVKFKFETLLKQVLSSFSFCNETGFEFVDPVQYYTVPPGNTSTKLHTYIILEFTQPVKGCQVLHSVSVDIVPALRIDDWWPDDMHGRELCKPGECLIVFTQPQVKYPWIGWTQQPHGFITFARAESRLLRDCPSIIKAAYMVVKRMSKYFCQYEFFSSHAIKMALFWCLDEDRCGHNCTSSRDSDEIRGDELLRWVQNILRRLLCFAAQDYIPSYFLPECHQPVWLSEKYLKQFHMRLYQHGLTYKDLFSLNEQQSQDRWLQLIKALFVFSHIMYWTVSSETEELKLFIPSTINPLTEDHVCTTLLPVN